MIKININDQLKTDMTQHRYDDNTLLERLKFEQLLSDISARLIVSPFDQVDAQIESALRRILDFFQVDRCGLIEVLPERQWMKISHASYGDGITTVPQDQDSNIFQFFPWLFEKIVVQGQPLALETLDDLPPKRSRINKRFLSGK